MIATAYITSLLLACLPTQAQQAGSTAAQALPWLVVVGGVLLQVWFITCCFECLFAILSCGCFRKPDQSTSVSLMFQAVLPICAGAAMVAACCMGNAILWTRFVRHHWQTRRRRRRRSRQHAVEGLHCTTDVGFSQHCHAK